VKDGKHVAVRVDGGPATHAFTSMKIGAFGPVLLGSLASTYLNPWKFDRFARGVLREHYKDGKGRLRADMGTVLWKLLGQAWTEKSRGLYPVEEGFGRTDALGRISNAVFADELDSANYRTGNAPVSYPYLWNIWKFDWVQYNASVNQPMARNMGESLGVGARIHLTDAYGRPLPPSERYHPATLVENLVKIEDALQRLEPPRWPEELLGKIDRAKAEQGKALFAQHCSHCHGVRDVDEAGKAVAAPLRGPKDPLWQMTMLDLDEVGTDPTAALNFALNRLDLRKSGLTADDLRAVVGPLLEADRARRLKQIESQIDAIRRRPPSTLADWQALAKAQADLEAAKKDTAKRNAEALAAIDPASVPLGAALNYVGIISRQKYYDERGYSQARRDCMDGFGALDMPQVVAKYKARPLQGAWATAPFLHNGSVPNLYELLSPVTERTKRFFLGRRAYDPVKVGFVTEPEKGLEDSFWYDTRKPGNSNVGHEFRAGYVPWTKGATPQYGVIGPALSPDERFAIVEYLKIHEDPPTPTGRVPPDCSAPPPPPRPTPAPTPPTPAPTPAPAVQGDTR
jgi:mono/diheme cytochrome c family protein